MCQGSGFCSNPELVKHWHLLTGTQQEHLEGHFQVCLSAVAIQGFPVSINSAKTEIWASHLEMRCLF